MIYIENIDIAFRNKVIFKSTSFEAEKGEITLIKGESGIGKSTFIDVLLNKYPCTYYFNKEQINKDDKTFQSIVFDYYGVVYQTPKFFGNLTLRQHIDMILNIFTLFENTYLEILNLQELLDKQVRNLSAGERTRCSLLLALLKQPKVLILDEPTASLDKENKEIVIKLLQTYTSLGNIVIATSHDPYLIDVASKVYEICDYQMKVIKDKKKRETEGTYLRKQLPPKNMKIIKKAFYMHRQQNKIYNRLLWIISAAAIASLFIALFYNQKFNVAINNTIEENLSKDFIVYDVAYNSQGYGFSGISRVLRDEEIEAIEQIPNIEKVEKRLDLILHNYNDLYINPNEVRNMQQDFKDEMLITTYENNTKLTTIDIANEENKDVKRDLTFLATYHDIEKSEKFLFYNENVNCEEGVVLSNQLFNTLFVNEEARNELYIEFDLPVPIYNASGIGAYYEDGINSNEIVDINNITCEYKKVKLPIIGVLKPKITLNNENDLQLYVSYQMIEDLHQKLSIKYPEVRDVWNIDDTLQTYYNELPSDIDLTKMKSYNEIHQEKWSPNALSVRVKNIEDLDNVISQITKKGYYVESQYYDGHKFMDVMNTNTISFIYMGVIFFSAIFIFNLFLKFNNNKDNKIIDEYLVTLGFEHSFVSKVNNNLLFQKTIKVSLLAMFIFYIVSLLLQKYTHAIIYLDMLICIYIILTSILLEFIVPLMIRISKGKNR